MVSQISYRGFACGPTGGLLSPSPLDCSPQMKIPGAYTAQHVEDLVADQLSTV